MENLVTPSEKNTIDELCVRYSIEDYTINSDGSIDVSDPSVFLFQKSLSNLPLKFNKVTGFFVCHHNRLTSLENAPIEVGGSFTCCNNELTSLKGCPQIVGKNTNPIIDRGSFDCANNKLTSLEYCPTEVGGEFRCANNDLPQEFYVIYNALTSDEVKVLLKYQHYYDVWTPNFNEANMTGLVSDIKDGLR
jgi:hypothetical protein